MCGIAGIIDLNGLGPADTANVRGMSDLLFHRGPDEAGYWQDEHAALGHRRLSIIDLAGGQQPMLTPERDIAVVFNGEIYNYRDVRAALQKYGHTFKSTSDTECLLHGYRQWGDQLVEHLNGMFAFVIWDVKKRRALMARDRVGKKPLFYHHLGGRLSFASELSALRHLSTTPSQLNHEAMECYFTLGYVPAPMSIIEGVHKVSPAQTISFAAGALGSNKYWHMQPKNVAYKNLDEAGEVFEPLFSDAVKIRMESEVPLGAFLSGGIDSSLVVSAMAAQSDRVITNTIGVDDKEFDESSAAALTAKHFGTDHHLTRVKPDALDVLNKVVAHLDEPLADPSVVPTWYVCEMARKQVTVALSGDGGDEPFGGYDFRYMPHLLESRIRFKLPPLMRSLMFGVPASVWPSSPRLPKPLRLKSFLSNLSSSDLGAFHQDLSWLKARERKTLFNPSFIASLNGFTSLEKVAQVYRHQDNSLDALTKAQLADIQLYMTDDVLVKVDRMSMGNSLEVRAPLLDYRLIEFAQTLPAHFKLNKFKSKILLRHVAKNRVPKEIVNAPKRGFTIPTAQWLRHELKELFELTVLNPNSPILEYMDSVQLKLIWRQHQNNERDHHMLLWGLLIFVLWTEKK